MQRSSILGAVACAALATALPLRTGAQTATLTPAQWNALSARANAYFQGVANASFPQLDPLVTRDYRMIRPDGQTLTEAGVINFVITNNNASGSAPKGQVKIGAVTPNPDGTLNVQASAQSYSYYLTGGTQRLLRYYSEHVLTWRLGGDGVWRVAVDRVTSAHRYV